MSGLTNELHLQLYATSPAPKRDYHGLTITKEHITLNSWDISHGPHVFPRKMRTILEEFHEDILLQREIQNVFGDHVLQYALQLSRNEKTLITLPHKLFLKILRFLASNDIIRLGQTSKIFFELCNTNPVWKIVYRKRSKRPLNNQELLAAEKQSWKYLLKKKLMEKFGGVKEKYKMSVPKPSKECLDRIQMYSKPIVHKKRSPPTEIVPKLDIDLNFSEEPEKVQNSSTKKTVKTARTLTSTEKETSRLQNPEHANLKLEKRRPNTASPKIFKSPGLEKPNIGSPKMSKSENLIKNKDVKHSRLNKPEYRLKGKSSPVLTSNKLESSPLLNDKSLSTNSPKIKKKSLNTSAKDNTKISSPIVKSKNLD